jgi:hypothetical protein
LSKLGERNFGRAKSRLVERKLKELFVFHLNEQKYLSKKNTKVGNRNFRKH